eukprot:COSAG02_NODE_1368_length_13029_cov_83.912142_10_plen_331_part_00
MLFNLYQRLFCLNAVNAGGPSSIWPASGFRLCPLINELASVRSTDNSTNLRTVLVVMALKAHPTIMEELRSSLPTAALAAKLNLVEMEQSLELLSKQVDRMRQESSRCAACTADTGPAVHTLRLISSLTDYNAVATREHEDVTPDNSQSDDIQTFAHRPDLGFGNEISFGVQLEAFANSALPQLDNLRAELRATSENYRQLMQYLGEVPADGVAPVANKDPGNAPPPPPPPPLPARSLSRKPGPLARRRTPSPPAPAQLFAALDSFSTGLCAAASEVIRKNTIEASKQRANNARRKRLGQLQRQSPTSDSASTCDERTSLLNQIRLRRHG